MISPEERYMWWMKSACHLEGTCITAHSKLRLSFPWEFSQRDIKMLYDLTFIFRAQSFSQFFINCHRGKVLRALTPQWVPRSHI